MTLRKTQRSYKNTICGSLKNADKINEGFGKVLDYLYIDLKLSHWEISMGIYLLLFITVILGLVIESEIQTIRIGTVIIKSRTMMFIVISAMLFVLGIFKGSNYGYDVNSYKIYYFDYLSKATLSDAVRRGIEPGFALLSFIICKMTNQFWVYRAILFGITFGGISKIIWNKSKLVSLSYLIFISFGFLSFDMFILRQALAVTITFLGLRYLESKQYIKFSIIVLLASTFHYTALLTFALLPLTSNMLAKISFIKRSFYVLGAICAGGFLLPQLIGAYRINDYSSEVVSGEGYGFLLVLVVLFLVISIFKNKYTVVQTNQAYDRIYEFYLGSIYIQIIALFFSLFNRTVYFALIYGLICIPNLTGLMTKRSRKWFLVIIGCFMTLMYYMTILNATDLIPYISILG